MNQDQNQAVQAQNFFFEKVKTSLENKNHFTKLCEILKKVDSNEKLNTKEFELVGMFSYILGIDYISQKTNYNQLVTTNVINRINALNLLDKTESIEIFFQIMENMNISLIEESKEKMKNQVSEKLKDLNGADIIDIRMQLTQIINNSLIPIRFILDVNEILERKINTYQDILKLNSFIYNEFEISGDSIDGISKLYKNKSFISSLDTASKYFDNQKFSFIYFDSILSLSEYQKAENNPSILNFLENEELIKELPTLEEIGEKLKNEAVKTEPVEEIVHELVDANLTDEYLKAVLQENANIKIKTEKDFEKAIDSLVENDELVQQVYQFIKIKISDNRKDSSEIYGDDINTIAVVSEKEEEVKNAYVDLVTRYTMEIPADNLQKIVIYVNGLIKSCFIDGKERKAFLMQQLYENQITTYKHLHQTIGLIEECKISGKRLNSYINLRNYLLENEELFVKIFDEVAKIDVYQTKISLYGALREFFNFPKMVSDLSEFDESKHKDVIIDAVEPVKNNIDSKD